MVKSSAHYTCGIRWSLMDLNDCCPNICDELAAITIKFYGLLCGLKTAAPTDPTESIQFPSPFLLPSCFVVHKKTLSVTNLKKNHHLLWRTPTARRDVVGRRQGTLFIWFCWIRFETATAYNYYEHMCGAFFGMLLMAHCLPFRPNSMSQDVQQISQSQNIIADLFEFHLERDEKWR